MLLLMLVPAILCGLLLARPGALHATARLRGKSLILVAAALQFIQVEGWWQGVVSVEVERRAYGLAVTVVAVAFSWLNRDLARRLTGRYGLLLLPVGATLNAVPMVAIGAMPYSAPSAVAAGYSAADAYGPITGYVRLDQTSHMWLPVADVIPIPILEKVVSVGDIALLAGSVLIVMSLCASDRWAGGRDRRAATAPRSSQTGDASPDLPVHTGKEDRP